MVLSKIEKIIFGLGLLGAVGSLGGLSGKLYLDRQIDLSNPAVVRGMDIKHDIGKIVPELGPTNGNEPKDESYTELSKRYHILNREYQQIISQPDIKEKIIQNEKYKRYGGYALELALQSGILLISVSLSMAARYLSRKAQTKLNKP